MYTLTRFSQGEQLRLQAISDATTRRGVCVGLCDYWLSRIKANPEMPPDERLGLLRGNFSRVMNDQRQYAGLRARQGRERARQQVGSRQGLRYSADDTAIMRIHVGMNGIRAKIAEDIGRIGAAATWTLRFRDGGGHAIAGFCGVSGRQPISHLRSHIFDPNIGEYVGPFRELDYILSDMMSRVGKYSTIVEVHRTTEG